MKHGKVLIEPIAESKDKKKGMKNDNKVVHSERERERDEIRSRDDGKKEVDKGRKQTGDEMLLPNRSYQKKIPKTNDCYLERNRSDKRTETRSGETHQSK